MIQTILTTVGAITTALYFISLFFVYKIIDEKNVFLRLAVTIFYPVVLVMILIFAFWEKELGKEFSDIPPMSHLNKRTPL